MQQYRAKKKWQYKISECKNTELVKNNNTKSAKTIIQSKLEQRYRAKNK